MFFKPTVRRRKRVADEAPKKKATKKKAPAKKKAPTKKKAAKKK
jgi:hypothetical protein